jgi:hypothetical protein
MAGKFLRRGAIIDTVKDEHRTNAIRKRKGLTRHPITATSCGCPDPNCGAFHLIRLERTIPTIEECKKALKNDNKTRKCAKRLAKKIKRRGRSTPS